MKHIPGLNILIMILTITLNGCGMIAIHSPDWDLHHFSEDFEDFSLAQWSLGVQDISRITWTSNARSGTNAVAFTIYPGDYAQGGSRAELSWSALMPYGADIYLAYSLMLASNYLDSGRWQILGQWHDQPDVLNGESWEHFPGNSPPVSLHYTNQTLGVSILYQDKENAQVPLMDYTPGSWVDLTFHIKWSLGNDGYVEGWTNGSKWFEKIYAPTLFNRMGNYFKIGIYRGPEADKTNTVYYDAIHIGSSFGEVQP